ncbi:hypothetical protein [Goodfellowiella coeruleoviolacea]|uniref:Secreted protein n=1 Tax=Goodfellowiella coeruleoviolacea TaxID=334858 RepID=A0AAE3G9Q4_9PSEU|nr:hypothetical protein [Goodfellowiella coeruleoviolacea]MCP2164251.1 hypothetical protein [Goodfellowiella coeruleoviolacea]
MTTLRRRTVLAGLFAPALASAVGALLPGTASAAVLPSSNFKLIRSADNSAYDALVNALPRASVSAVLDSANRTATPMSASAGAAQAKNFAAGFDWQSGDNTVTEWIPQGITTSADAYDAGTYEGRDVVLVSWYDSGTAPAKGVRISFVDRTTPTKPVYRHVLLVEPTTSGSNPSYKAISIHAGGLMWYGNLLYVVDTNNGLRVFDLNNILQVSTANDGVIGRGSDGTYSAYGYLYVLPQKFSYQQSVPSGVTRMRFSFVSLDRTTSPDSILVGEFDEVGDGSRLFRFNIDYTNRELVATNGTATAAWAYEVNIRAMQGAASVNGKYYISRSNPGAKGDLVTWVQGQSVKINSAALPYGTEDFSYVKSRDEMWTLSEHAGSRHVLAVRASAF